MKLFDPMRSDDPRATLLAAYEYASGGGQALIVRTLGDTRLGHLIDADVLRLQLTVKRYIAGTFRFRPQVDGLMRVDLIGRAFDLAMNDIRKGLSDDSPTNSEDR